MRIFIKLFLLLPMFLSGALTFDTNHQKEVTVLQAFDIAPAFANDPMLNAIIEEKRSHYQNKHFFQAMDNAYLFIPLIKSILAESDIPAEFLFLAMAESNFSSKAYSNKRASGLWQFMPYTGKLYGLKIDDYVDERRDLVKSTQAAVKFLNALHKRFGKWYLAALAYNCGEGRVSRAIARAGTDELNVLLDEKKCYLPQESRRYIRKIVALALLGSDESFLIKSEYSYLLNRANAYSLATVQLPRGERLSHLSDVLQIPLEDIKNLNRHLNYDFVPPYSDTYDVYIPYIKLSEFKQKYTPSDLQRVYIVHTVKKGDNLSSLGKKYKLPYTHIKDFNKLKRSMLSLNQKLIIPISKPSKDNNSDYIVRSGDTLSSIARLFKLSVKELKSKNRLSSNAIRVGEKLTIYD